MALPSGRELAVIASQSRKVAGHCGTVAPLSDSWKRVVDPGSENHYSSMQC
jgi:hypothetical protein